MAGEAFDSNVDPQFQHVMPLYVNLTNDRSAGGNVIDGWRDGFALLNKGAKAKLYIPSELAYGPMGNGPKIGPNTILVFDVEVTDFVSGSNRFCKQRKCCESNGRIAKKDAGRTNENAG